MKLSFPLLIGLGILIGVIFTSVMTLPVLHRNEIKVSCEVSENDIQYCLRIVTYTRLFSKNTSLFVTRGNESPSGLAINYPEFETPKKATDLNTTWSNSGLKIVTPLGYEIWVPRELYIGGR